MRQYLALNLLGLLIFFGGCGGSSLTEEYKLNKKYWNHQDYKEIIYKIKYLDKQEVLPSYKTPERLAIFLKLVDDENVLVVAEDESLGIQHRAEVLTVFFNESNDLKEIYSATDREDKFLYPKELAESLKFNLLVQLHYFELGNREIEYLADDPNSNNIKNLVNKNIQTLIGNYSYYLDYVKREKSFDEEGLNIYISGLDQEMSELIKKYPNADYFKIESKANAMLKRAESDNLKSSIQKLLDLIESKKSAA